MTRRLRTSVTLVTAMLATVFLTMPAAATEVDNAVETGFGTGEWDGMIVTAIVGLLLGVLTFMTSDPGGIPRAGADHH